MNAAVSAAQVESFRALVARQLGLNFDETKTGLLTDVLQQRVEMSGLPADPYMARLEAKQQLGEFGALARELTVGETYFFRNIDQFHALRECVLPERFEARGARRCLRILSAGCASGEEAYSIAMMLRDMMPSRTWELSIRAVDLKPAMMQMARQACYTNWALRETPPAMQQRWFRLSGRHLFLDDAIRADVTFDERQTDINLGRRRGPVARRTPVDDV